MDPLWMLYHDRRLLANGSHFYVLEIRHQSMNTNDLFERHKLDFCIKKKILPHLFFPFWVSLIYKACKRKYLFPLILIFNFIWFYRLLLCRDTITLSHISQTWKAGDNTKLHYLFIFFAALNTYLTPNHYCRLALTAFLFYAFPTKRNSLWNSIKL